MTTRATFGRRGAAGAAAILPAPLPEAFCETETAPAAESRAPPAWSRGAAFAASFAAACALAAPGGATDPLDLAGAIFDRGGALVAALWLTQKLCILFDWRGLPAFAALCAGVSPALALAAAMLSLDAVAPDLAAAAGAGAGGLYCLLAARAT